MNSKNTVEERWKILNNKSKKWHQFISVPMFKSVPLVIILIIILELINGYRNMNLNAFIVTGIVKIILAYVIGTIHGYMEWEYIEMLVERKFSNIRELKQKYILIYGIFFFGFIVTLSQIEPLFDSWILTIAKIIIYLLSGLCWGILMVVLTGNKLNRFVENN